MEKIYNKLVRDNIPKIIEEDGEIPIIREMMDVEYKEELYRKLLEECNEVLLSKTKDDTITELADVYEVLRCIAILNDSTIEEVAEYANQKRLKRGGFEKKIYLEKTISK